MSIKRRGILRAEATRRVSTSGGVPRHSAPRSQSLSSGLHVGGRPGQWTHHTAPRFQAGRVGGSDPRSEERPPCGADAALVNVRAEAQQTLRVLTNVLPTFVIEGGPSLPICGVTSARSRKPVCPLLRRPARIYFGDRKRRI